MAVLDDREFERMMKDSVPLVVKFFSMWDSRSRALEEGYQALSDELSKKARFMQSNINVNPDLAEKMLVTKIPTVIVFKNGEMIAKIASIASKRALKEQIENVISKRDI